MNALIINPLFDETSPRMNGFTRELAHYSHEFSSSGGEVAADNHPSLARAPSGMESFTPALGLFPASAKWIDIPGWNASRISAAPGGTSCRF